MIRHAVQTSIENSQMMWVFLYHMSAIHECNLGKIIVSADSTKEIKMI
jgi:hypothetical protein